MDEVLSAILPHGDRRLRRTAQGCAIGTMALMATTFPDGMTPSRIGLAADAGVVLLAVGGRYVLPAMLSMVVATLAVIIVVLPPPMGNFAAIEFLLFSGAVLSSGSSDNPRVFTLMAGLGLSAALLALSGVIFGHPEVAALRSQPPDPEEVGGFTLLFVGLMLSRPQSGLGSLLLSPNLGGRLFRIGLPGVVALPLILATGTNLATLSAPRGLPMTLVLPAVIVTLTVTLAWLAARIDRLDRDKDRALASLRQSEADFRTMQDVSLLGVMILAAIRDDNGHIADFRHRYVNPAAQCMMGLSSTAPDSHLSRGTAHADDTLFRVYLDVMETGQPMDHEFSTARLGQRTRWFRALVVRLDDGVAVSLFEITAEKESLRTLARAEARFRSVVDTAVDAMVVIDENAVIHSFNLAAEKVFGYTAVEAIGQPVSLLMPEPHRTHHQDYIQTYKRTGIRRIIGIGREVEGLRKDGSRVSLDLSITEWFDGPDRYFTDIMRDITQRKQAESALRDSESRFRAMFEQAAVGIEQIGLDGTILDANAKLCAMLGFDRDEVVGRHYDSFMDPAFLDAERLLLGELLTGRRSSYALEKRWLRKDGTPLWVRVTSSLNVRGDTSRLALFEDISEQKKTLENLQAATTRLQLALDGARAGTWEWDIPNDRHLWSEETYNLIGIDPSQPASAETWAALVLPEDLETCRRRRSEALARGDTRLHLDMRICHPTRGLCWLSALARITYAPDGSPLRMDGITLDITPMKKAEEDAKAARDEAEQANCAKSRFLAAASHDLRQPVQAMVLLLSAAAMRLEGHPAAPLVAKSQETLNALQMLLDGLLDISRLDAGVVEARPQPAPVGEIVDRLVREYQLRAASRGIALRTVPSCAWGKTDPVLFERILRNLLENALRYTEHGKILVGCRRGHGRLRVSVCDTGVGIAPEHRQAIFQEFFQVKNPERNREHGLGLGLSIVKRLTAILGHAVSVASEPGRGSCFTVEIPSCSPRLATPAEVEAPAMVSPGSVMVIDDEEIVRDSLSTLLHDWGFEVTAAEDAPEAVRQVALRGHGPDLIIADYRLRENHTGTMAVAAVRTACGGSPPAIILTGDTAPERIAEVEGSGFLIAHKPIRPEQLRNVIAEASRRQA